MKVRAATLLLLLLAACGREQAPEPKAPPAVAPAPTLTPWTWHPLGSWAVIEGEVDRDTELRLEGSSIRERRFAELGPVRWEFLRPPEGQTAVLLTGEGVELARFTFATTPPGATPKPSASAPKPVPPAPPPPPPSTRTEARLPSTPVPPLPERKPQTLPRTDQAPPIRPVPPPPPARARAETFLPSAPVQPLPERKPLPLPRTDQAPATRSAAPTLPAWAQTETSLPSAHLAPLPGRRVAATGAPEMAPTPRRSTAAPNLMETLPARPPQAQPPLQTQVHAWPGAGEALNLTRGPTGRKRLLLSFDGGSNAEVAAQILDLLKARRVRSTFFLTGAFIQRQPALVRRMAAEGHELGNHTLNHPHFAPGMKRDPKWTRERFQQQLLDADAALLRLLGRPMDPLWRAPYGEHTAELRRWAEEVGYRHVGWSEGADTLDWATRRERNLYRSGEAILERLRKRLDKDGDGLIVLMHLGSERSDGDRPSEGLGAFMDRALKEGWTFVTAGDFVRDLGKPAWDARQRVGLLGTPPPKGR